MDMSVVAVHVILCILKDYHSGILKFFKVIFIKVSNSFSFTLVLLA